MLLQIISGNMILLSIGHHKAILISGRMLLMMLEQSLQVHLLLIYCKDKAADQKDLLWANATNKTMVQ